MCVYSTFTKYFREEVCHNFEKDIVLEKVQELQDRYNLSAKNVNEPLYAGDEQGLKQKANDRATEKMTRQQKGASGKQFSEDHSQLSE